MDYEDFRACSYIQSFRPSLFLEIVRSRLLLDSVEYLPCYLNSIELHSHSFEVHWSAQSPFPLHDVCRRTEYCLFLSIFKLRITP